MTFLKNKNKKMITIDQSKVLDYINANLSLKDFFTYYLNSCITLTNPYHNINHTISMMYFIIDIYELSKKNKFDFNLSENDLYILLLSAMFHDYNHSGGKYEDSINVNSLYGVNAEKSPRNVFIINSRVSAG